MQTLKIPKKQLETIGTGSLVGILSQHGLIPSEDKELTLEFEVFSRSQCVDNDGPDLIIIPEYVPACLLEDLITLIREGYDIKIGFYHTYPEIKGQSV